jgi:hypothetical protein
VEDMNISDSDALADEVEINLHMLGALISCWNEKMECLD